MSEHKKTGIIFSTYNNGEVSCQCLLSCLKQRKCEVFIVVADDGSTDNTVELMKNLKNQYSNFEILELPHGERGISRKMAYERIKEEKIDYIYIIDSDMILQEDLVYNCIEYVKIHPNVGGLIIPEIPFTNYKNIFSKIKVFERKIINNAGEEPGNFSIEAARFWKFDEYQKTGGINPNQIAFEETQPTIRYIENGGIIKRAIFTGVMHDEKYVTMKNLFMKKKYYFSQMDKTIKTEKNGGMKALKRWYFFRPVLYRWENILEYIKHPILALGMVFMYICLSFIGVFQLIKSKGST